jgi:hypothetical protein
MLSKSGLLTPFHAVPYITSISFDTFIVTLAPAIELPGYGPVTDTPAGSTILRSVIGPSPFADTLYVYMTSSPATAWIGSMYAYAAGVDVYVTVIVGVAVYVGVKVSVAVNVGVSVGVAVPVGVSVGVAVNVGVSVGVAVYVGVSVGVAVNVGVPVGVAVNVGVPVGVAVNV